MESIEQVKQSFDLFLTKYDGNQTLFIDTTSIKEILHLIIHCNEKYFYEPDFLNHRLFIILRDYYLKLLQQWRLGVQSTIDNNDSSFVFETIPNIFIKMSNHISDKNIFILKEIIFHKSLINELNLCLEEIALNGKYLQDPQIKSLDNIFRAIQRLQRSRLDNKTDPLLIKFFDHIVKCICSSSFIQIFIHSTTQETDDVGQKFLLHTCTDYIYSHPTDQQHKQSLLDIRQALLRPFSQWLTQQASSFHLWNNRTTAILRQLCFILTLSIQLNRYAILEKDILDNYCQLIDSFLNIFSSIFQLENPIQNKIAQSLMGTLTPNLYTMILSNQLEKYLKNKHMTTIILNLADIENDEIQLNAFRILSTIITEQDTKKISISINIANLFIKFLNKIIDDSNQMLRFFNLLRCLKNLILYDQIKDELIKQNGISLLLRCVTETKFKPLQAQQPALEILLSLSFKKEGYRQLKENIIQIKPLLSSSHQGISRAVDGLLWRLEKQEEILFKSKFTENISKYDIMISYSHSDRDLTYRIYDRLIKDDFRVWIDRDETFGTSMITKAEAINQSKYVFICMSDDYKQNLYCRCEAYYAYGRQCHIIPLILALNYQPDEWLLEIINTKIYIDFVILDFDLAYKTLQTELHGLEIYPKIEQPPSVHSKVEQISSVYPKVEQVSSTYPKIEQVTSVYPKIEQISSVIKLEYSSTIEQWTKENVKSFLIENQFNSLFPIVSEMNGCLLYDLYTMCNENRESMFHTLKNEISLLDKNVPSLTLFNYLRFLNEIRKSILH